MKPSAFTLLVSLILVVFGCGDGWSEVRVGTVAISPETPILYTQFVKYLTVPLSRQGDPAFNGVIIANIKALEDPLLREIYDRMSVANPEVFPFTTLQQAQQHWLMRLKIIDDMKKMNTGATPFRYYTATNPPSPGSAKWKLGTAVQFYFVVKPGQSSYDALKSLLSGTVYGECAGAISTCVLDGAATALGQVAFDIVHPAGTLGIGWQPSIYKHIYTATSGVHIPGDIVYFKNKSDYLQKCKARNFNGYWQGENCLYMGGLKYSGLGARSPSGSSLLTTNEMRTELKTAYESDTQTEFIGKPETEIKALPPLRVWLNLKP